MLFMFATKDKKLPCIHIGNSNFTISPVLNLNTNQAGCIYNEVTHEMDAVHLGRNFLNRQEQ
jgi:hypothetical protein